VLCICVRACTPNCSEVAPKFQKETKGIAVHAVSLVTWLGDTFFSSHWSVSVCLPGDRAMRGNASICGTTTAYVPTVNEIANHGRMPHDQWKVRLVACLLHGAESLKSQPVCS